jgi:hypothetical protein
MYAMPKVDFFPARGYQMILGSSVGLSLSGIQLRDDGFRVDDGFRTILQGSAKACGVYIQPCSLRHRTGRPYNRSAWEDLQFAMPYSISRGYWVLFGIVDFLSTAL